MKLAVTIPVLAIAAGVAGVAKADFFSFASDSDPNGPTFAAPEYLPPGLGRLSDGGPFNADQIVRVNLLWDADEHGPGSPVEIPADFIFNAEFRTYQLTPITGGFIHSYVANGSYAFFVPGTGQTILQVTYQNAVFTSLSESAAFLGSTATFQSNDGLDPGLQFQPGGVLSGRELSAAEGFAFSLSSIEIPGGNRPPVDISGIVFPEWRAEGSWSARAIPSPGSLVLLSFGVMAFRRSRKIV